MSSINKQHNGKILSAESYKNPIIAAIKNAVSSKGAV